MDATTSRIAGIAPFFVVKDVPAALAYDQHFRVTLEPDGQRSHWLKVTRQLREPPASKPATSSPWS